MPPEKFKHILTPENPRPTTSASTHKTKKSCSIFRLKLQCTYLIAREPLSRAFTYKCIGISVTWGPSKASRAPALGTPLAGDQEGLSFMHGSFRKGNDTVRITQQFPLPLDVTITHGAIPPTSTTAEWPKRVTPVTFTISREQAYRHELPNTNTPLCLLSFPPPLPAVIPHDPIIPKHQPWSELGTAQGHSWEQGHPAHALSCTAQISHCMDPVAGLLPEKTASHKVLNGFHYYFSCRILLVAVLGRSLCLDTVLLISGYFHPVFNQTWSHTTPQHHPEQPGTTNAHQKIQKYIY